MSKKENENGNVIIGGEVIERLINLCEDSAKRTEEKDKIKEHKYDEQKEFIAGQLERVATRMCVTDVQDDKYRDLVRAYDALMDVMRYL